MLVNTDPLLYASMLMGHISESFLLLGIFILLLSLVFLLLPLSLFLSTIQIVGFISVTSL